MKWARRADPSCAGSRSYPLKPPTDALSQAPSWPNEGSEPCYCGDLARVRGCDRQVSFFRRLAGAGIGVEGGNTTGAEASRTATDAGASVGWPPVAPAA